MATPTRWRALVEQAAARYELDADLLEAQVLVESSGDPDAFRYEPGFFRSYVRDNPRAAAAHDGPLAACSYGLLQILLETARELGFAGSPAALFVPEAGLDWGARYLRTLVDWAGGDVERALCAYNGGRAGNVVKPYRNQVYADRVFAMRDRP